ncbi:MAG: type II toxin-antitoxin system Phd/YefM family antitoxin [Solirubrobacteraceae bacterium]
MARSIAHRELRNNSGEVLRRVAAGEEFEVTNHGEVVAVLLPVPASDRAPSVVRRVVTEPGFAAFSRIRADAPSGMLLDELRADR